MNSDQMTASSVAPFLVKLFSGLASQDIRYVVLRNYEGLPDNVEHDIDLLLDEIDLPRYRFLLRMTAEACGWRIVRVESRYGFWKCYLYNPDVSGRRFLQIDAFCPQHYRGIPWFPTSDVLSARQRREIFYVPAAGHEAMDLVLKELLGSGRVKRRYVPRIVTLLQSDSERFKLATSRTVGQEVASALLHMCRQADCNALDQQASSLRFALALRAWRRQPWAQFVRSLRFIWGHIVKYMRPSGFFICLIGPDGSGKTSVADGLCRAMDWTRFQKVHYHHGRFSILPELKKIRQAVARSLRRYVMGTNKEQHHLFPNRPHSPMRAVSYLLYYTLDYLLGHILVLHARANGELLICDRYFYDYMIQWTFRSLPDWLPWLLARLIPKPDMVVFLSSSAEVIYSRKQDIPIEEMEHQIAICRKLVSRLPNACTVEGDTAVPDVVNRVIDIMMVHMGARESKRLNSVCSEEHLTSPGDCSGGK